jgi:hypothetical protein
MACGSEHQKSSANEELGCFRKGFDENGKGKVTLLKTGCFLCRFGKSGNLEGIAGMLSFSRSL